MQRKLMVTAILAVIALVLAMPLMAQTAPTTYSSLGSEPLSNTKFGTATIFTNDVDNFINYHKYSTVLTDDAKWFAFVTGRTNQSVSPLADLGYARNFGSLYLGAWYRGNIAYQGQATETHSIEGTWDDNRELLTSTTERTLYGNNGQWLTSHNNFEFLIGVAGQGIKVGFLESYAVDQNPGTGTISVTDYLDGRKDYTNATLDYQNSSGHLKPYIGWGSNFAISGANLMPYVDFALDIFNSTKVDNIENYTEVNGVKHDVAKSVNGGYNNSRLTPTLAVGAKVDLPKKNTTVTQLELRYDLSLDAYNNDYGISGLSGSVPGTVAWGGTGQVIDRVTKYTDGSSLTNTNVVLRISEQTRIANTITLGYKVTGEPFERFKLGFSARIPVSFGSRTYNDYTKTVQKDVYKFDDASSNVGYVQEVEKLQYDRNSGVYYDESSNCSLSLGLSLGASYKLIPDRLAINAGISATPFTYTTTTNTTKPLYYDSIVTTKTTYDDGTVTENKTVGSSYARGNTDSVDVIDTWGSWTANLRGGFLFNFSPKAALDLAASAGATSTGFSADLTNVNVIFTFKF